MAALTTGREIWISGSDSSFLPTNVATSIQPTAIFQSILCQVVLASRNDLVTTALKEVYLRDVGKLYNAGEVSTFEVVVVVDLNIVVYGSSLLQS